MALSKQSSTTISEVIHSYGSQMGKTFPDRTKTIGASEIGLCARRMHFLKKGYQTDAAETAAKRQGDKRGSLALPENWGAHVRGSVIEEQLWAPAMRAKFGDDLKMAWPEQQTLTSGALSATPDGVVVGRGNELLKYHGIVCNKKTDVVVECKSIDPRVNLVEEKAQHAYQVQVQMGLIRELTPYKPLHAIISYVDASFWQEVSEFVVAWDEDLFEKAKSRAARILAGDPHDQKPEGWIAGGKECGWCPWSRLCNNMRGNVPTEEVGLDQQKVAEILDLCREALKHHYARAEADEKYREMQDVIKTRLQELGTKKVPGVVNWVPVKGRTSWDMDAVVKFLEKKKIKIEQFKSTGEPSSQLTIDKKIVLI
jgi:hypothetical protein